jgi:hypothetical protein
MRERCFAGVTDPVKASRLSGRRSATSGGSGAHRRPAAPVLWLGNPRGSVSQLYHGCGADAFVYRVLRGVPGGVWVESRRDLRGVRGRPVRQRGECTLRGDAQRPAGPAGDRVAGRHRPCRRAGGQWCRVLISVLDCAVRRRHDDRSKLSRSRGLRPVAGALVRPQTRPGNRHCAVGQWPRPRLLGAVGPAPHCLPRLA